MSLLSALESFTTAVVNRNNQPAIDAAVQFLHAELMAFFPAQTAALTVAEQAAVAVVKAIENPQGVSNEVATPGQAGQAAVPAGGQLEAGAGAATPANGQPAAPAA